MAQQFQPPVPTLPGNIQALLHPSPTLICDSLPDYLTNSMIHVLRDSSRHATKRRRSFERELEDAGLDLNAPGPSSRRKDVDEATEQKRVREEEEKEVEQGLKERLEAIGRVVGAQITEQSVMVVIRAQNVSPSPGNADVWRFVYLQHLDSSSTTTNASRDGQIHLQRTLPLRIRQADR